MPKALDEAGVVLLSADIKTLADATYPANAAIASEYSSSNAYDVGDYCLYQGLLYKCNTTIAQGGEAWTTVHWTQVNVANELQARPSLNFQNVVIPTSAFMNDITYDEFPYRVSLALLGVTESMIPDIIFDLEDVMEGIFSPICYSYNGGIYLYSNDIPLDDITIPLIICWI